MLTGDLAGLMWARIISAKDTQIEASDRVSSSLKITEHFVTI